MQLAIDVAPGGAVTGSGFVVNDTNDSARFTVGGRYPEVTFTVATANPAIVYYDGARFRGTFRSTDEIVGSLTVNRGQQVVDLTLQRGLER